MISEQTKEYFELGKRNDVREHAKRLLGIATVAVILVFCIWGSHCQKRRRRRKTRQREQFRPRKRGKYEKA